MTGSNQRDGATPQLSTSTTQTGPLADTLQQFGPGSDKSSSTYVPGYLIAAKYQLTSLLGEGGMGAVWLARNQTLHVDVAIKLIRRDIAVASARDRLLREARAAASLSHSSIVRVHDFGETTLGDPFIVMELLVGESLSAVLERKGNLSATRAAQILLPIVSALAEVHALGIVHRDLKPENIILVAAPNGSVTPKLVDFGIAKWRGRERAITQDDAPIVPASTRNKAKGANELTQWGAVMGSPNYMSPEQARADHDVDERADLWAVAVMLYEAVAGRRPFEGKTLQQLLIAVLGKEAEPLTEDDGANEALWAIVARGLKRDREERWQSARGLGRALAQWLLEQHIEVDIAGTSIRQHWLGKAIVDNASLRPPDEEMRPLTVAPPTPTTGESILAEALRAMGGALSTGEREEQGALSGKERGEDAPAGQAGAATADELAAADEAASADEATSTAHGEAPTEGGEARNASKRRNEGSGEARNASKARNEGSGEARNEGEISDEAANEGEVSDGTTTRESAIDKTPANEEQPPSDGTTTRESAIDKTPASEEQPPTTTRESAIDKTLANEKQPAREAAEAEDEPASDGTTTGESAIDARPAREAPEVEDEATVENAAAETALDEEQAEDILDTTGEEQAEAERLDTGEAERLDTGEADAARPPKTRPPKTRPAETGRMWLAVLGVVLVAAVVMVVSRQRWRARPESGTGSSSALSGQATALQPPDPNVDSKPAATDTGEPVSPAATPSGEPNPLADSPLASSALTGSALPTASAEPQPASSASTSSAIPALSASPMPQATTPPPPPSSSSTNVDLSIPDKPNF